MKRNLAVLAMLLVVMCGCAMMKAWKSIPPPGGCDQCHTLPISNDWQVAYQAPHLTDEHNLPYFQKEQATLPPVDRPASSLDIRKVEELPCFDCHRSPNSQHNKRTGRYHH